MLPAGLLLAFGLLAACVATAASQERDPALRLRLKAALAEPVSFEDRYDAEVWLTDMAGIAAALLPTFLRRRLSLPA